MADDRKPDCKLHDAGSPVPASVLADVIQVTVDEPVDGAAVATIKLRDADARNSGAGRFAVGNELRVELGYVGETQEVFSGEVTAHRGAFTQRGKASFTVVAQDRFHRLRRNRRQKTFLSVKDSQAVEQVAREAGLKAEAEATPLQQDVIHQWNQTDADFVLERASLFSYVAYVAGSSLAFHPPRLGAGPSATVTWHRDLYHFDTQVMLGRQQRELQVTAWDMKKKQALTATAAQGDERDTMGGVHPGAEQVGPVDEGEPTWQTRTPARTQEEVEAYAKARFHQRSERFVEASGTCQGDPAIRRDTVVEVDGVGDFLAGSYYARRVVHSLLAATGYTTTFHAVRPAVGKPPTPPPAAEDAGEPPPEEPERALLDPDWEGEEEDEETQDLRMRIEDEDGEPLSEAPFKLTVDGTETASGETTSDGYVTAKVPKGAQKGELELWPDGPDEESTTWPLRIQEHVEE